ncbi:hypothetical protein LMG9446_0553 [Lactococcus lactis subsp. lactis]|nr:hypothetical protein LMG9446_0553 [Lactococcus lactis subsp. lactis]
MTSLRLPRPLSAKNLSSLMSFIISDFADRSVSKIMEKKLLTEFLSVTFSHSYSL